MVVSDVGKIKIILKSLVLSSPGEMTVEKLGKDFKSVEGQWIPYGKLGFRSLEQFLNSLTDTLVIKGHGKLAQVSIVATDKSKHINEMVSSKKKNAWLRKSRICRQPTSPKGIEVTNTYGLIKLAKAVNDDKRHDIKVKPSILAHNKSRNDIFNKKNRPLFNKITQFNDAEISDILNAPPLKSNQSDLTTHQDIYWDSLLHKQQIHHKNYITNTTGHLLEANTYVSAKNDKNSLIQGCCQNAKSKSTATKPDIKNNCNANLSSEKKSLTKCVFLNTFDQHGSINNDFDEAIPEFAADSVVFRVDFPENTVTFGHKIPPYKLPTKFEKGVVVGVFITEVHNPFKFWLHLHKENHELDYLMNQIEKFYTDLEEDEYLMPASCISPGQICAALFNNLWHRAEILTPAIKSETKIFFLDYGTVSKISVYSIKYLVANFAGLPAQAIRGSLSHIKPTNFNWNTKSTELFLSLISERLLYAQISEIDVEDRIMRMVLCDTNFNATIQVNKSLVTHGVALFDYEWNEERLTMSGHRQHHPREDFPTFEMVENGEYPSYYDLSALLHQGIDYERIADRRVFNPGKIVSCSIKLENELNFPLLSTNPFKCDIITELCRSLRC